MKRVLLLAYYFPPIGGAGVQRWVKFARYLPEFGYDVSVVTGPAEEFAFWTPEDRTMMSELPETANIYRIPGPEPPRGAGWLGRKERWLGISEWKRWWVSGLVETSRLVREPIDLISATMSPYESAAAAMVIARERSKPWVAGLRDPWALDEMVGYPSLLHRRRAEATMRRALHDSDGIIVTAKEAEVQIRRAFPEIADTAIVTIPNGFDDADFAGASAVPASPDSFRIVHAGYLHTELGIRHRRLRLARRVTGGTVLGADALTRSHVYLLQAVDALLERNPALADVLEVHLVGQMSDADRAIAAKTSIVRIHGYKSHAETTAFMRSANLLFLPMQALPAGVRARTVPGKTYEYLAARRPILAAVPDGDARDILDAAGNAYLCRPHDAEAMAAAIETAVTRWRAGEPDPHPDEEVLARFERRRLTEELAAFYDALH